MRRYCKPVFTFLIITFSYFLYSQAPFITTWKTDNPGVSCNTCITIPTYPGETYNYSVDWNNDGVYDQTGITGDVTHDFGTTGTKTIRITGTFPRIYFFDSYDEPNNNTTDNLKLLSVNQWGTINWSSFELAFYACSSMNVTASDVPLLNNVTDLSYMFCYCSSFNANVNNWDVSNISKMTGMFAVSSFNQPLSNWNVSNVTDMNGLFSNTQFNQPLNNWNVSAVTNMSYMFNDTPFNQNINNWNVSNVNNMEGMFASNDSYNQSISNWNVSNVSNFSSMFYSAGNFNQPIGNWNVANVTDMSYMFWASPSFNQPIGSWEVSNVTSMRFMFSSAINFNQPLSDWDVSSVTDMTHMFYGAKKFNKPIENWNVSNVTSMAWMFYDADLFNQTLSNWNVSNVINMSQMFSGANSFDQNLGNWTLTNTVDVTYMLVICGMSCNNYSLTLMGWANNSLTPSNLSLGATGRVYGPAAVSARNYLVNNKGWTISGDSYNSSCVVTLPLSLLDFSVQKQPNNISKISWETQNENLVSTFSIYRSPEAIDWEYIGKIEAKGEANGPNSYSFIDDQPLKGTNYYRLSMNDLDGNFEYSPVRSVYFGEGGVDFEVYGSDKAISIINNNRSNIHYFVYNSIGRIVADTYDTEIPVPQSGIYLVSDGISTKKVYIR
ncbi:MAG: DUF285 domain-containing protein [Saprospiraceae bacterium]|nr:DUF285 domain-containing protein [Saprospiraceae bacterium]